MKFKVGDKVKVIDKDDNEYLFKETKGKSLTVIDVEEYSSCIDVKDIDGTEYHGWCYSRFELVESTGGKMKIKEANERGLLKVGARVRTNGSGSNISGGSFFKGIIGEINEENFFVWQDERHGDEGELEPSTRGLKYSWVVSKDNDEADIEFLDNEESRTTKISDSKNIEQGGENNMKTVRIYECMAIDKRKEEVLVKREITAEDEKTCLFNFGRDVAKELEKVKNKNIAVTIREISNFTKPEYCVAKKEE